ncbi:hypothetical protein Dimus_015122 [Dionaea muscipula]
MLQHKSLLGSTVLCEHRGKLNPCGVGAGIALLQVQSVAASASASASASSHKRNPRLHSGYRGKRLNLTRPAFPMATRHLSHMARAALTTDPTAERAGRFSLDGDIVLQVEVIPPSQGCACKVVFRMTNSYDNWVLHWGVIREGKEGWTLPAQRPEGTKVYKDRALRTPFQKFAADSSVKLEIADPSVRAIEFLIHDEGQNKWFKNNGKNFHVKLPVKAEPIQDVSVPEDLVQVQAYLRWERKGKQMYTPEQEKTEYEAARAELLEEVVRGVSVEELRRRLRKGNEHREVKEQKLSLSGSGVPDELVQIQAYIRWEKAGKPIYSPDKQLREFEEARKELQMELDKGTSLDEIRLKIIKGDIQTKVSKQLEKKSYFTPERIQRKKRDIMQMLNKYAIKPEEEKTSAKPKALTAVELFADANEQDDGPKLLKKIYQLGDKQLLVHATKPGKIKVLLATDLKEPVLLHWGLSKNNREWLAPPPSVLPQGSSSLEKAAETPFTSTSAADTRDQLQHLEIQIEGSDFVGMPFVLLSSGNWIKDNGSDFYIDFTATPKPVGNDLGDGRGTAKNLLEKIATMEDEAQKSFMHRFNIAAELLDEAKDAGQLGLAAIFVWMRFMATRQLIWNKNYNVKPREISKAQDRLTDSLQNIYRDRPQHREILRMIMSTVGRGGEGDVGQRIRDEILVIQRKNHCAGGMMEEWHQKLHNNTSPDDVVICQALIDYLKSDLDISIYWKTLNENGITKERLLSYDRAIHSEPNFNRDQKEGLLRDLGNYLRTLKAVHSGADLEAAVSNCMGYQAEGQGFMVGVQINPVAGLPSGYPELLHFVIEHVEDRKVEALLEGLLEARQEIRPLLFQSHDRLKDLIFLDIALDSTVRTATERGYEEMNNAGPEKIMHFIALVVENLALSSDNNEDLIYCLKGWSVALDMLKNKDHHWALFAKSVLDRTRLSLASKAEWYQQVLQPSAEYLGSLLAVDQWAVNIFTEEIIRAGSAASLSSLLNRLDPVLRKTANLGSWQIISPVEAVGYVVVVDELLSVQNKYYDQPTVLVAKHVKGEEEIPDGVVAVLTPDMPDVLSHVSVRARNSKICFATCYDGDILADIQAAQGKLLRLKVKSADIIYSLADEGELNGASSNNVKENSSLPLISLARKNFAGRYAISSEDFTSELVGAKSRNISFLKGKVPSWIGVPTSVALPFGAFEEVLADGLNQEVAKKMNRLKKDLEAGDVRILEEIRKTVLQLAAPPQLVQELKSKMLSSGMPWPGDEGEQRWEQAWLAIKKVWASKWNDRAYFSTMKVGLDHDYLSMAVLVQEVISADYAFVIHTTNPSSGDATEIYAEVVKGLGETLVGAYPGRALSFCCKKNDLDSPMVLGYPSKPIGLYIKRSIIFRSDSNGEDLEGYAGAGLYDSVPMDEEERVVLDYSSDPLINNGNFRQPLLSSIARAGNIIEELYGSPQDIEGVVKDGKIYVVQTRPQM